LSGDVAFTVKLQRQRETDFQVAALVHEFERLAGNVQILLELPA